MTLTRREKTLLIAALAVTAGWSLYGFLVRPACERIDTLNRVIAEKQTLLGELKTQTAECRARQQQQRQFQDQIAAQPADFQLLPYLESLTGRLALPVASLDQEELPLSETYRESVVEMQMSGLRESQLMEFLSYLQTAPARVQVKSLDIHKTAQNLLELTIRVGHITNQAN